MTAIKKATVKEFWVYYSSPSDMTGLKFKPGSTGVDVSSNLSGAGGVEKPLNIYSLPELEKMEIGQQFELTGEVVRQKVSAKGKVISTEIIPNVPHRFVVEMGNQSRHVSGAKDTKIAWRIV